MSCELKKLALWACQELESTILQLVEERDIILEKKKKRGRGVFSLL
jgi:hypothetical protein